MSESKALYLWEQEQAEAISKVAKRLGYLNPVDPQPGDLNLNEEQRLSVAHAAVMAYWQIQNGPIGGSE